MKQKNDSTPTSLLVQRLRPFALAAASLPLIVACASMEPQEVSIADALAAPDDTQLVVTGSVVQQLEDEKVLLRDSSGQITAEVDDDLLGDVKLAPNARVRVMGEIDRDSEQSVLEARTVQVLP